MGVPPVGNDLLLALAYMDLLIQGVYPVITGFTKFTPIVDCIIDGSPVTTALLNAVKLTYDPYGEETPLLLLKEIVYKEILQILAQFLEKYPRSDITGVTIRVFRTQFKPKGFTPVLLAGGG